MEEGLSRSLIFHHRHRAHRGRVAMWEPGRGPGLFCHLAEVARIRGWSSRRCSRQVADLAQQARSATWLPHTLALTYTWLHILLAQHTPGPGLLPPDLLCPLGLCGEPVRIRDWGHSLRSTSRGDWWVRPRSAIQPVRRVKAVTPTIASTQARTGTTGAT